MLDGNAQISMIERQFTFAEAARISEVEDRWLRSFLERDDDGIAGEKHRLGRWLFSVKDCFTLAVIDSLNSYANVPPSTAKEIAKMIAPEIDKRLERDAAGQLKYDPHKEFNHWAGAELRIATSKQEGTIGYWEYQHGTTTLAPSQFKKLDAKMRARVNALGRAYTVIPIDFLWTTICNRAIDELEANE